MPKNALLGMLAAAALAGAGYFLYRHFTTVADNSPLGFDAAGVCLSCRQDVNFHHGHMEIEPFQCTACGKTAVYKWMYCNECHKRFVPDLVHSDVDNNWHFPQTPVCRNCKCQDVQYFVGEVGGQTPIGDIELPRWPPKS